MKNLTIKKIAFGLLLAGYASSSAFATLTATTNDTIQGSAPVLSKLNGDVTAQTVTVTFTTDSAGNTEIGANDNVKVGDWMKISYRLLDKDGDVDTKSIQESLTVFTRTKDASGNYDDWQEIKTNDLKSITTKSEANTDGVQLGYIIFQIDDKFAGVDQIGFKLQERTDFGAPSKNHWLNVSDVWSSADPVVTNPGEAEPTTPPSTPAGPGDQAPGKGPIVSDTFKVGIFKYDAQGNLDTKVDYAAAGATNPKYGDKFGAVVWNDADKNGSIDDGELIKTSAYTFKWTLDGNYEGVAATEDVLEATKTTADGDTIYLGSETANHNSIYNTTYKAGAQGYRLKVTTNE